jgi:gluconokinase
MPSREVLCFDIGTGGVRAARFNERLEASIVREHSWDLHRDAQGHATLSAYDIETAVAQLAEDLQGDAPPVAVCIGSFMHSFLVLSSCCAALTPVFTWLDTTAPEGLEAVRRRLGDKFHERTGCHYHPMFPVFKLAANAAGRGNRVASPKAWLGWELTGEFADDYGMAAASGLLNAREGKWDDELMAIARLELPDLPRVVEPYSIVGVVPEAHFGIPAGTPVVSGSGDGFLANIGSGCTTPKRMAVTLGTSGVARQMVPVPALNRSAGTFCYRASSESFLLGCASSNGGNVLDWARKEFGMMAAQTTDDLPIFLPWMNGERSLEWNPDLKPVWHGRTPQHTPEQLARAVVEGVMFNLAQYVEVVERESGVVADEIVLSGNGFLDPALAPMLASLLGRELMQPPESGLATLRGAAICAWRGLGVDASVEGILRRSSVVKPIADDVLCHRFERFKIHRGDAEGVEMRVDWNSPCPPRLRGES